MADVFCIGETMAMVTPAEPAPLQHCELFRLEVGGAESTVALYLRELGHRTSWVSRLGADPLGARVRKTLDTHGVDTSWVQLDDAAPTGVYFKDPSTTGTRVHYYRAGSAASRMSADDLRQVPLEDAALVHVSGITAGLSETCHRMVAAVLERLSRTTTLVSFDVNYRPALWSVEDAAPVLLELARQADVVLVGRDEAETLWDAATPAQINDLLGHGSTVVIKDGAIGATEFDGASTTFVASRPVEVVEVVGAGDAFAAGYLSGRLRGLSPEHRLELGHELAARALTSTKDFVARAVG